MPPQGASFTGSAALDSAIVVATVTALGWLFVYLGNRSVARHTTKNQADLQRDLQTAAHKHELRILEAQHAAERRIIRVKHRLERRERDTNELLENCRARTSIAVGLYTLAQERKELASNATLAARIKDFRSGASTPVSATMSDTLAEPLYRFFSLEHAMRERLVAAVEAGQGVDPDLAAQMQDLAQCADVLEGAIESYIYEDLGEDD